VVEVHNYEWNHQEAVPFQVGIVKDGGPMEVIKMEMPVPTREKGSSPSDRKEYVEVQRFTLDRILEDAQ